VKQVFIILWVLTLLVRPLWPIAEYIVNYEYIVTHLCENRGKPQLQCDGKCYLAKMLAKEKGQEKENPFEGHRTHNELMEILFLNKDRLALNPYLFEIAKKTVFAHLQLLFSSSHYPRVDHPPEV